MTQEDHWIRPQPHAATQPGRGVSRRTSPSSPSATIDAERLPAGRPSAATAAAARSRAPLPPPPTCAQAIPIMPAGLSALRAAVARRADRAGLTPARREDLVLAVNELATNSIRHGGGAGTLTIWETDAALVCEVTDAGRQEDPRAGSALSAPGQVGHYGLWIVNRVCDLVEQRALPHGNLVRVWMRRD